MLESLWDEHNVYLLHVDLSSPPEFFNQVFNYVKERKNLYKNVHFMNPSYKVVWSGISVVKVVLEAIKQLGKYVEQKKK